MLLLLQVYVGKDEILVGEVTIYDNWIDDPVNKIDLAVGVIGEDENYDDCDGGVCCSRY